MDIDTAKSIFTRMYQSLDMLRLLDENKENESLSAAGLYKKFLQIYPENPNEHFFANHQFFMGCLLAFIVIRQGTVDALPAALRVETLDTSWHLSNVTINVHPDGRNIQLNVFVRKLRNAISHARFWANNDDDLQLTFQDRDVGGQKKVNFEAKFPLDDLYAFCKRFNEWVITER